MKKTFYIFIFCLLFNLLFGQTTKADTVDIVGGNPEVNATYPGGTTALKKYLDENVTKKIILSADESSVLKKAYAKFIIDQYGNVDSVSIVRSSNIIHLDSLLISALKKMPKWTPATLYGKPIRNKWILPYSIHIR